MVRLGVLVGDLQQLANVAGDAARLTLTPVALRDVADAVAATLVAQAAAKRQTLTVTGAAQPVDADAARMRHELPNLASNAVKYTAEGGHIRLMVEVLPAAAIMHVADNGMGVAADELPSIFDFFTG